MSHWWRRDELLALLQAWRQTLPPPRDRDELRDHELQRLAERFDLLRPRDGAPVPIQEVEAQRQRLVRTFLFLRAFNAESARAGRPSWFQLPPNQQDTLRRMNGRLGDLAAVAPDEFDVLAQICEEPPMPPSIAGPPAVQPQPAVAERPMADEMKAAAEALAGLPMFRPSNQVPTLSPSQSPPSSPPRETMALVTQNEAQQEGGSGSEDLDEEDSTAEESEYTPGRRGRKDSDLDYMPPKSKGKAKMRVSKWSKRHEKKLIEAWHEVVTTLVKNGFEGAFASRNEGLRLNSLIHQRYVELCDANTARTNQSTGAKKHAIIVAFRALRTMLRTLASQSDRPNWFGMTPEERMEVQKRYGQHHEPACFIEKDAYQRLVAIVSAQEAILNPVENPLRAPVTLDELLGRNKQGGGDARKKVGKKATKAKYVGRGLVAAEKSFEDDEDEDSSDDDAALRNGGNENASRGANAQAPVTTSRRHGPSSRDVARRPAREVDNADGISPPSKRRRTGLSDVKWVARLLDAQTQRFEALLAEFQEERRQERQHNMEIIVEALKLRSASATKADQPSEFVGALVEKQRQHMLGLFNQLQEERSQEREQARTLLRELGGARLVASPDEELKE
jgi:hypothetical protein